MSWPRQHYPLSNVLIWQVYYQNHDNRDKHSFHKNSVLDMEQSSSIFTVVLNSKNPLMSTATLTNNFDPQQKETNLTCASTSAAPSPSQGEFAVLVLRGNAWLYMYILNLTCMFQCICVRSCVCTSLTSSQTKCIPAFALVCVQSCTHRCRSTRIDPAWREITI